LDQTQRQTINLNIIGDTVQAWSYSGDPETSSDCLQTCTGGFATSAVRTLSVAIGNDASNPDSLGRTRKLLKEVFVPVHTFPGNRTRILCHLDKINSTACGVSAWQKIRFGGFVVMTNDALIFGLIYSVDCNTEGGDVVFLSPHTFPLESERWPSTTQLPLPCVINGGIDRYGKTYRSFRRGTDVRLWVDNTRTAVLRESFAFSSNGTCFVAGRPVGESGIYQFGSAYLFCWDPAQNSYVLSLRWTVNGASQFGAAVQFFANDTRLAVGAPGSDKVYIFMVSMRLGTLVSSVPSYWYNGTVGTLFGARFHFAETGQAVIMATGTTTCANGAASTSGSAYLFATKIDCVVTPWNLTSNCSAKCGNGTASAVRSIVSYPLFGGTECPALQTDTLQCEGFLCPVDCVVSDWVVVSACSASCDGGTVNVARTVLVQPLNGGAECPPLTGTQVCNTQECPPVDCVVSDWNYTSTCNATCDGGYANGTRTIVTPPSHGGAACPALNSTAAPCNTQVSSVSCGC
jgi:hypothetical protein